MSEHRRHGRRQPYTNRGVRRIPCFRCGAPSSFQWQVCADNNLHRTVCTACDIELNKMVLRWMNDPDAEEKIRRYEQKLLNP